MVMCNVEDINMLTPSVGILVRTTASIVSFIICGDLDRLSLTLAPPSVKNVFPGLVPTILSGRLSNFA